MNKIKHIDKTLTDKIIVDGAIDIDKDKLDYFLYDSPDCLIIYPDGKYACGFPLIKDRKPRPIKSLLLIRSKTYENILVKLPIIIKNKVCQTRNQFLRKFINILYNLNLFKLNPLTL